MVRIYINYFSFAVSSKSGGILDKAIEAEDLMHKDFLKLVIHYFIFLYREAGDLFVHFILLNNASSSFVDFSQFRGQTLKNNPLDIHIFLYI